MTVSRFHIAAMDCAAEQQLVRMALSDVDGMKGLINARLPWFSTVIRNQNGSTLEVSAVQVLVNESKRMI